MIHIKKALVILAFGLIFTACGSKPIADFTWSPEKPKVGEEVKFTNLSSVAKSYSWNFGDMSICDETNPTQVYEKHGNYIIDLAAHNGLLTDEKTVTISVIE